jgi:hypothetical protein
MSYSVDEWFGDNVLPKLKELVECEDLNTTKFTDFIKEILNDGHPKSERFASLLLEAIVGDEVEGLHKKISKCFSMFTGFEDCELVSLTYKEEFDLIECKYNVAELQD